MTKTFINVIINIIATRIFYVRHMNNNSNKEVLTLLENAQTGDQSAFEILKEKYEPLIASQVQKHILPDMNRQDIEDLRQEALIVFCRAVSLYDINARDVEFGLYAKICIENALVSSVRSYVRKNQGRILSLNDSGDVLNEEFEECDQLQRVVNNESFALLVNLIKDCLSEYESRVWWLYVSGMSVSEIAKTVGDTEPRSVSNAIYRIRKKLRSRIGGQF